MKKLILFCLVFVMCLGVITAQADTSREYIVPYKLIVDMKSINADNVLVENGRTMVPLRELMQATGASVDWDNKTQSVSITKDNRTIKIAIGSYIMETPEGNVTMDTTPFLLNGTTTYLPLRAICEAFDFKVYWDTPSKTIVVESPGGKRVFDNNYGFTLEEALQYHGTTAEEYLSNMGMNTADYPALKDMYWWQVTGIQTLGNVAKSNNTTTENICKSIGIDPNTPADTLWVDIVDNMTIGDYIKYMTPAIRSGLTVEEAFEVLCMEYELEYKYTKYYRILKANGITYDVLPTEYTTDTKYKFLRLKIEEAQFTKGDNDNAWYVFDEKVADLEASGTDYTGELTKRTIPFTIHMKDGKKINGVLYPELKPAMVSFFIRLAKEKYFDGLVFDVLIADEYVRFGYCDAKNTLGKPPVTYSESSSVTDNPYSTLPLEKGLLRKGSTAGNIRDEGVFAVELRPDDPNKEINAFGKIDEQGVRIIESMVEKTVKGSTGKFGVPNDSMIIKKVEIHD